MEILKTNQDINLILSEFDTKEKELGPIYKSIIKKPLNFLKITTAVCPDEKTISRNFTDYYTDYKT